ncbi:MAG: chorismate synthase [Candidatus Micrarchaeia archaeon]
MNTLGSVFRWSIFGESHGKAVGVLIDGCPAGLSLDEATIQRELDRRRPGQSGVTTPRKESDKAEVLSGVFNGRTTGAPIAVVVRNVDVESGAYEKFARIPRPGHADYTAWVRYGGFNDYRGAGHLGGRLTAGHVIAGAIAKQALAKVGIRIAARAKSIGKVCDARYYSVREIQANAEKNVVRCVDAGAAKQMIEEIERARAEGDSLGGIIECVAEGVPAGLGEPRAGSLHAGLAHAMLAIPAVRGFILGSPKDQGSENNDEYAVRLGKITTKTNNCGGILAGISTGMPIWFDVIVKPPSTIAREQASVDLKTMKPARVVGKGRHDPCIIPRAVPVVEAQTACVLLDFALWAGVVPNVFK